MDPLHEKANAAFQGELDTLHDGATLQLLPREFPGPVVAKHPLILDGQGATIWALKGPVVSIHSDGVVLRNVKIEFTGEGGTGRIEDECALLVKPGCGILLESVEVRGSVIGLQEEEGEWRYPNSLQLGHLTHGHEHDFVVRVAVPVPCRITSNISGLEIQPHSLKAGTHEIRLHVERLSQDTLLNGSLSISTAFLVRRIMVNAHIMSSQAGQTAPTQNASHIIWEPDDWATLIAGPQPQPTPPPAIAVQSPPKDQSAITTSDTTVPPRYIDPPVDIQTSQQVTPQVPTASQAPPNNLSPPISTPQTSAPPSAQPVSSPTPPAPPPVSSTPTSPSRTRRIQSTPLSPLFSPTVQANESGEAEAESALKSSVTSEQKSTQSLSPLFLNQQNNVQPSTSNLEAPPTTPDQKIITEPNITQDQNTSTNQPTNNNTASSHRAVRFKPASSIFGQASTPSQAEDKTEETDKKETEQRPATQANSQPSKKRVVHSTSLSPLFGGDAKKEKSDKGK